MKIIKKSEIDLEEKYFLCDICKCGFTATKFEYGKHDIPNHCTCPICGGAAGEESAQNVLGEAVYADIGEHTSGFYDYLSETMRI